MSHSKTQPRGAYTALLAAFLGWLFDGFEMGLFPLIGKPALQDLLPGSTAAVQGQWFSVIIAVFLVGAATGADRGRQRTSRAACCEPQSAGRRPELHHAARLFPAGR